MPHEIVVGAFVECHHAQEAAQRIQNERTEVGCEGKGQQGVGSAAILSCERAEAGEDAMRKSCDGRIGGCGWRRRRRALLRATDERRRWQPASRWPVRGESEVSVKDAEVLRRLVVFTHCIGNASAGIHAAERGPDESEENGDSFGHHEVFAMALAKQRDRRQ